jgi:hypothetical protein
VPQRGQQLSGLLHLSAPHQALTGHALRVSGDPESVVGERLIPLGQIVNRLPAECPRPGERSEGAALIVGSVRAERVDGLHRALFGTSDSGHRDGSLVLRQLRKHRSP